MAEPIKKIVVATDLSERSDRALRRAMHLAKAHAATLDVVSVVDDAHPKGIVDETAERVRKHLEQVARADGVTTEITVETGDVYETLVQRVNAEDADLVILGLHRPRVLFDAIRETTMERLVQGAKKPVLLVKEPGGAAYERVLAPVSFSPACEAALAAAIRIAEEAEYELFHAWMVPFGGLTGGQESDYADQVRAETKALAEAWQGLIDPRLPETRLIHGAVGATLRSEISRFRPDLLAIGAHTRAGPAFHHIGSFAADLIRDPPADILICQGARG